MRRLLRIFGMIGVVWVGGLIWYVELLPRNPVVDKGPTDGIVVLTGGQNRLPEALALLGDGSHGRLLISGVNADIDDLLLKESLGLDQTAGPDLFACCIDVGRQALDTEGNAREIADWAADQGYRSLLVVTAGYHMPRSLLEIRRVAPDLELVPNPVFTDAVKLENWWRYPGTARFIAGEYNKYLFALLKVHVLDRLNAGSAS